jgi:hypothetical protein
MGFSYRDSISVFDTNVFPKMIDERETSDQHLLSGLIRIHLLYQACEGPIFGPGMIEELHRHGYT